MPNSLKMENRFKIEENVAPAQEPVTRDQLADELKLDADQKSAESSLLDRKIKTARKWTELYLGKRLITATLTNYFNTFYEPLKLLWPPVQEIVSIKYKDGDDAEQTFSSSKYSLDQYVEPGELWLSVNNSFPTDVLDEENVVYVKLKCGYGDNPSDVPEPVKDAIIMKAATMFEKRIDFRERAEGAIFNLLNPYKTFYL